MNTSTSKSAEIGTWLAQIVTDKICANVAREAAEPVCDKVRAISKKST